MEGDMKKLKLGYDRKKAAEFYEAGYRIENDYLKQQIDNRKRNFIIFNF